MTQGIGSLLALKVADAGKLVFSSSAYVDGLTLRNFSSSTGMCWHFGFELGQNIRWISSIQCPTSPNAVVQAQVIKSSSYGIALAGLGVGGSVFCLHLGTTCCRSSPRSLTSCA